MISSSEWDRFCDAIDRLLAAGEAGSRAEAAAMVRRRYPQQFANVKPPEVQSQPGAIRLGVGSAEAQLDALARQHRLAHPGTSYAQAFCMALNSEPRLYLEYLRQAQARLAEQVARRD